MDGEDADAAAGRATAVLSLTAAELAALEGVLERALGVVAWGGDDAPTDPDAAELAGILARLRPPISTLLREHGDGRHYAVSNVQPGTSAARAVSKPGSMPPCLATTTSVSPRGRSRFSAPPTAAASETSGWCQ